jgi:hypothetical protein
MNDSNKLNDPRNVELKRRANTLELDEYFDE